MLIKINTLKGKYMDNKYNRHNRRKYNLKIQFLVPLLKQKKFAHQ